MRGVRISSRSGTFWVAPDSAHIVMWLGGSSGRTQFATLGLDPLSSLRDLTPLGNAHRWPGPAFSPDGARVVYSWGESTTGRQDVLSAPLSGGEPVLLDSERAGYEITPDGATVILHGRALDAVPITGGERRRLSGPPGWIWSYHVTPDSSRVVYLTAEDVTFKYELYSVPIDGSARVKLNAPLPAGGDVGGTNLATLDDAFQISPDGSRVVFDGE